MKKLLTEWRNFLKESENPESQKPTKEFWHKVVMYDKDGNFKDVFNVSAENIPRAKAMADTTFRAKSAGWTSDPDAYLTHYKVKMYDPRTNKMAQVPAMTIMAISQSDAKAIADALASQQDRYKNLKASQAYDMDNPRD